MHMTLHWWELDKKITQFWCPQQAMHWDFRSRTTTGESTSSLSERRKLSLIKMFASKLLPVNALNWYRMSASSHCCELLLAFALFCDTEDLFEANCYTFFLCLAKIWDQLSRATLCGWRKSSATHWFSGVCESFHVQVLSQLGAGIVCW